MPMQRICLSAVHLLPLIKAGKSNKFLHGQLLRSIRLENKSVLLGYRGRKTQFAQ